MAEDHAPVRVVLQASDGRPIDLHPVTFDEEGTGWQLGASPDGSDCPIRRRVSVRATSSVAPSPVSRRSYNSTITEDTSQGTETSQIWLAFQPASGFPWRTPTDRSPDRPAGAERGSGWATARVIGRPILGVDAPLPGVFLCLGLVAPDSIASANGRPIRDLPRRAI
jgi:hypothetical protein